MSNENNSESSSEITTGTKKAKKPFKRTLTKRVGYRIIQFLMRVSFFAYFRFRALNRNNFPKSGGALVCSNHQSNLDPPLVGHCCPRRLNYLARKTLFKSFLLRWIIEFLDAIPLDKQGMGIAGIKETMKRLKREEMVLIFPEGTRTSDGELKKLQPGFLVIARRTKVPLVPVGIDGAFQSWPRGGKFPRPSKIVVSVGEPIMFDEYGDLDDDGILELLHQRISVEFEKARQRVIGKKAKV